jgi:uncharacterized membrane protein
MSTPTLEQLVHEALDNAKDNGYSVFLLGSPQEIADDLIEYSVLDDHLSGDLIPHIETWQANEGSPS